MTNIQSIKAYTPPVYHTGREFYIDFYAFDPVIGKMKRKKIKLNNIPAGQRRKYAKDLMNRLAEKLSLGWNPWIEKENGAAYQTFDEVCKAYRRYIDKQLSDGSYRTESHKSLVSFLNNMIEFNQSKKVPITYIYQFDKDFCVQFLDEIYINRDNSAFTHDNYLTFLRLFSTWCCSKNYLKSKPTDGISILGKKLKKKSRKVIEKHHLELIHDYLYNTNKHYLLACYMLYYCFIRPAEMAKLKIGNISIKRQTIFIEDTISKNKKNGTVTLPARVLELMLDLNIFSHPSSDYVFSNEFLPGNENVSEKKFRDYWARKVRKNLSLPECYKFYSLKDTGITNMLRKCDVLTVRDQARHSSILMTDTYTPHDIQEANELIKNHNDSF